MPIVGPLSVTVVLVLIGAQLVAGLILTWFWRQTGNMAMPATMQAIFDAMRNALLIESADASSMDYAWAEL